MFRPDLVGPFQCIECVLTKNMLQDVSNGIRLVLGAVPSTNRTIQEQPLIVLVRLWWVGWLIGGKREILMSCGNLLSSPHLAKQRTRIRNSKTSDMENMRTRD